MPSLPQAELAAWFEQLSRALELPAWARWNDGTSNFDLLVLGLLDPREELTDPRGILAVCRQENRPLYVPLAQLKFAPATEEDRAEANPQQVLAPYRAWLTRATGGQLRLRE